AMAAIRDRGLPPPKADDLAVALSAMPALCQRFGLVPPAGPIDPRDRPRLALSVSALTRFLEDPLQGWAGVVIGLSQDDDEDASAAAVEDEPFTSERREVLPMIRRVFAEVMAADVPGGLPVLIARYREEAHRMMLAGTAPAGAFAEAERDHHERWLGCWHAGVSGRGRLRSVRFGAGAEALCLDVPLAAGAAGTPVEITGDAGLVIEGVGPVVLHHRPDIAPRIRLGVLARHAILAAAGILADLEVTGLIIADGGVKKLVVAPWSRDEARDYLTTIAGELFGGAHAYILPGDKALDWLVATHKHANPAPAKKRAAKRPAAKKPIAPLSDKIRADKYKPFGPIDRFSDLDVPDDAEDIAFRRLDPLARRWRS
ncbi:MAG TPA: hypothetical protein VFG83_16665, partial [Kofleriaceae bacterium]|nr:hypothetical protein [Kofleriaceae bacterium]